MNQPFHRLFQSIIGVALFIAVLVGGTGCSTIPRSAGPVYYPEPRNSAQPLSLSRPQIRDRLIAQYESWKGTRYRLGGMSRSGIDCSGFVHVIFRDHMDLQLPRTTRALAETGKRISDQNLAAGDLVLFKTGWFSRHVGIYIGDSRFIHASRSEGVTLSSLHDDYWAQNFWMARRVTTPSSGL